MICDYFLLFIMEPKNSTENIIGGEAVKQRQNQYIKTSRRDTLQQKVQNIRATSELPLDTSTGDILLTHLALYTSEKLKREIVEWLVVTPLLDQISIYLEAIRSQNISQNHFGVIQLRKLLTKYYDSLIQYIIDHACLHRLIEFAQQDAYPHLVLEATWCLTNLALGNTTQTFFLVQKNVISVFLRVSQASYPQIAEQGIWGIANICGDSSANRLSVIAHNTIPVLAKIYTEKHPVLSKYVVWVFSLICKFRPKTEALELVLTPLDIIIDFILTHNSSQADEIEDGITGIAGLLCAETVEKFDNHNFMVKLCSYYKTITTRSLSYSEGMRCAHHIIGMLCMLRPTSIDVFIQQKILEQFCINMKMIDHKASRRELCWILSNIAAGTSHHVNSLFAFSELIDLVFVLAREENQDLSIEALWTIQNLCQCKKGKILENFISRLLFGLFAKIFDGAKKQQKIVILDAANAIFDYYHRSDKWETVKLRALSEGFAQKVEQLQFSEDVELYFKAYGMIYKYFDIIN